MLRKNLLSAAVSVASQRMMPKTITCPKCGSEEVGSMWVVSDNMTPEYEWAQCEDCGHDWNECAREIE